MPASACANAVLPTPASPSRKSGRRMDMARYAAVATPSSARWPCCPSCSLSWSGDVTSTTPLSSHCPLGSETELGGPQRGLVAAHFDVGGVLAVEGEQQQLRRPAAHLDARAGLAYFCGLADGRHQPDFGRHTAERHPSLTPQPPPDPLLQPHVDRSRL